MTDLLQTQMGHLLEDGYARLYVAIWGIRYRVSICLICYLLKLDTHEEVCHAVRDGCFVQQRFFFAPISVARKKLAEEFG